MTGNPHPANRPRRGLLASLRRAWKDDHAAQIVEFAVSMPLLVVFVVGIFDFSQALSVKQKLMNAAREAARVAAADPANDLGGSASVTGVPASVNDANQVVDLYLLSENLNDCGLKGTVPAPTTGLQWVATTTGSCPAPGISLTVDRGCVTPISAAGTTIRLIGTCVTLSYAYKWRFSSVMSLLGGNAAGPSSLTATAEAFNEN
jgi:Flp pilus assembly protein TadG